MADTSGTFFNVELPQLRTKHNKNPLNYKKGKLCGPNDG
jgi:hypothetical protein